MAGVQFTPVPVNIITFVTQETNVTFTAQPAVAQRTATPQVEQPISVLGPVQGPKGEPGTAGATGATGVTGSPGQTIVTVKAQKTPTGTKNGVNKLFTLPDSSIVVGSLTVTLNGLEEPVVESGNTFTFTDAPINADVILCRYQV